MARTKVTLEKFNTILATRCAPIADATVHCENQSGELTLGVVRKTAVMMGGDVYAECHAIMQEMLNEFEFDVPNPMRRE